jgi:hypothetical protein
MEIINNITLIKNIISLEDLLKEIKEEDSLFILEQKIILMKNY